MKIKYSSILILFLTALLGYGFFHFSDKGTSGFSKLTLRFEDLAVTEIEIKLGADAPQHYIQSYDEKLARAGEKLIKEGSADYNGKSGKIISSYFNCTDCHNLYRETDDLTEQDPQKRLDYLVEHKLPYTAGSTFFGIYNRNSFYNGDYDKKYGELVYDARDTLTNAVQLCAKYCASGRYLEQWELDAIMHFFKKEELKISDLRMTEKEIATVQSAFEKNQNKDEALKLIRSKYPRAFGATFTGALPENERKYGENGDISNGEKIYSSACLYCHENSRVTYLNLNDDVLSGKYLWKHREGYDDLSIYQVVRWGTYPIIGRKQYMPLYTKEKMSNKQLEDLMAYIKHLANK
ncbi:MAG: c-type cytochrome [Brumimicrobium sp.]|nr:c-type cytochrome [Brumimicrobium sp.]